MKMLALLLLWTACLHDLPIRGGVLLSSCLSLQLFTSAITEQGEILALGTKAQTTTVTLNRATHQEQRLLSKRALMPEYLCTWNNACFNYSGQIKHINEAFPWL